MSIRLGLFVVVLHACAGVVAAEGSVEAVFSKDGELARVLEIEAAIARAQAAHGIIPKRAADEITRTATLAFAPPDEVAAADARLQHRMEAVLEVWRSRLSEPAKAALHHGVTTVDVYDTVLSLQLSTAIDLLLARVAGAEADLAGLAAEHRNTPIAGRTLGQHALPMTFGKKLAVWVGEFGRSRERLCEIRDRVDRSVILKGPVGSYAGLGPDALSVERRFARELGKPAPYPDDWHGARDVYAEAALEIALLSRSLARLGQEIFLLQSTDIGEVSETRPAGAVSSSSMPQKVNPAQSEALMHYGRTLPRRAEIILDDVVNFHERDNTARSNAELGRLFVEAEAMVETAERLIAGLAIDETTMRKNLERSGALLRAQAAVQALTPHIGRDMAAAEVKSAALASAGDGARFLEELGARPLVAAAIDRAALARILDPYADLAGAGEQVDAVLKASAQSREAGCARD